jgi:hypothetical protein
VRGSRCAASGRAATRDRRRRALHGSRVSTPLYACQTPTSDRARGLRSLPRAARHAPGLDGRARVFHGLMLATFALLGSPSVSGGCTQSGFCASRCSSSCSTL